MMLWLLYGMIGSGTYIPSPIVDLTGNLDYYRRYLDDTPITVEVFSPAVASGPIYEDVDYLRRFVCDTPIVDDVFSPTVPSVPTYEDVDYLRRFLCDT